MAKAYHCTLSIRTSGKGVLLGLAVRHFEIAERSTELYTRPIMTALLSLESKVVKWPIETERKEIKRQIRHNSLFLYCLGFIDGASWASFS